jgi:transketolase
VVAAGITVHEALKAAQTLESEGIAIRIIDAYCVKPLDGRSILEAARETGRKIIVVEDHYEEGGLGDAVLDAVGNEARVIKLAVRDIPRSGPPEALIEKYGIGSSHIVAAVKNS